MKASTYISKVKLNYSGTFFPILQTTNYFLLLYTNIRKNISMSIKTIGSCCPEVFFKKGVLGSIAKFAAMPESLFK